VVNVSAIGAGGGSIIWVDNQGVLKVGPLSAGALPGPVSYQRGGNQPAVTDCYVTMGILRPDRFLGGRMSLDRDAAVAALETVAARVGIEGADAAPKVAEAALRIASAKMATELFKTFAQRGLDPRQFTLIAFGGAGPTQANLLAEEIGLKAILIPASPGTLCALGALVADLKRDYVRTARKHLAKGAEDAIAADIVRLGEEIVAESKAWLAEEGDIVGPVSMHWRCDARYEGEGGEMEVVVPPEAILEGQVGLIADVVHKEHKAIYGFSEESATIEIASIRCQVTGEMPTIDMPIMAPRGAPPKPIGEREVFCRDSWVNATVFRRQDLAPADVLVGPALVEQEDTTVWILPGWQGRVNDRGLIIIAKA
jgi:N-methylhydantoinase A